MQPLLILVCILTVFVVGPIFTNLTSKEYFGNSETWTYFRNIFPATGIQFFLPGVFTGNIHADGVNGSLWTLIVEERLYLIVSVFFLFKKQQRVFALLMIMVNILFGFKGILFHGAIAEYLSGSPAFYAMVFLNAGLLYQLDFDFKSILKSNLAWLTIPLVAISFVFPLLQFLQVLLIPFCVVLIAQVSALTNKAGKWGDFTYGVYIFAFPVQQMLIAENILVHNPYNLFLVTMAIVLPLSALSWHLLEKRCLNYKKLVV